MSRLGTVIRFEFVRAVRKPAFWIGTLALPVVIVVVSLLVGVGQAAGSDSVVSSAAASKVPFHYVDHSGLVSESVAKRWGGSPSDDPAADRAAVRAGTLDAFITFPSSPSTSAIRVEGADRGLFENGGYSTLAERVLEQSVAASVGDDEAVELLRTPPQTDLTTYADGRVAPGWLSIVPPFLYVAAFFGLVVLLATRMVTVVVEEKENRISEMILTTVTAGDLIRGKVVAMLLVGFVQVGVFIVPACSSPWPRSPWWPRGWAGSSWTRGGWSSGRCCCSAACCSRPGCSWRWAPRCPRSRTPPPCSPRRSSP